MRSIIISWEKNEYAVAFQILTVGLFAKNYRALEKEFALKCIQVIDDNPALNAIALKKAPYFRVSDQIQFD